MSVIRRFLPVFMLLLAVSYALVTCNLDAADSRYCAAETRNLTDDELVERIMTRQARSIAAGSGVPPSLEGIDSGYETYLELIQANPDCCTFHEITAADPPNFRKAQQQRSAVGIVSYQYRVPYMEDGIRKYHQRGPARVLVSACGLSVSK